MQLAHSNPHPLADNHADYPVAELRSIAANNLGSGEIRPVVKALESGPLTSPGNYWYWIDYLDRTKTRHGRFANEGAALINAITWLGASL